ncbi:agmatinase [Paracoccus sp. IB05]|uniref:agmatinase n=1 Tax=Paracoccus sp. IB05 TaxID=2779367 RepID=UPI0018E7CCF6|nr:agmatinase [Paracoccus sp. IB05]MBJ2153559.1 agmatinase [Paracoccus sp. IB05]
MPNQKSHHQPLSSDIVPRYAGIATFMRLPQIVLDAIKDLDIGIVGIPWDSGTTNRPGARHGPRQVRDLSALMRRYHPELDISPYEIANCADLGDAPVNPLEIVPALDALTDHYRTITRHGVAPLSVGGDHLVTLPVLRALAERHGPLGMIQFDAHSDLWDVYFNGSKYAHGTPFRRAIEEGILDPHRLVQIGLRGGLYSSDDNAWGVEQGVHQFPINTVFECGIEAVMADARRIVGAGKTYVTFDIDCLDPAFAPGTGTPEVGGFTTYQAQKMLRSLRGLNLIGADVVEVSPPFDPGGSTALAGATMLFELLCLLAERCSKGKA